MQAGKKVLHKKVAQGENGTPKCTRLELFWARDPWYYVDIWLDAQHRYTVTERLVVDLVAPHAAAVVAVTADMAVTALTHPRPTRRLGAVEAQVEAPGVVAGRAASQGRAGREAVRLSCTRLPKWCRSHQSAIVSRA